LVLQILAQHAGKVVTRQQIMKQVWGASHLDDTQLDADGQTRDLPASDAIPLHVMWP
jgi:hypothetical protein